VLPRKLIRSIIEDAIAKKGDACPFLRTEPGVYIARNLAYPEHFLGCPNVAIKNGS
jgi:hypothetical protein